MSNLINFAAYKNERRVAQQTAAHEAARAERLEKHRRQIVDSLGGTLTAHVIAEVATELKAKEEAARFVPAYCDPANEVRGSKYDATRGLGCKEIAARIRQDIKDALKSGALPKGVKVRCFMPHYGSIEVRVTALPEGFRLLSDRAASWCKQFPTRTWDIPLRPREQHSEEYNSLIETLENIREAYNRDNSDSMTDYFDVRYYGSAGLDSSLSSAMRKAEIEASTGDLWCEAR